MRSIFCSPECWANHWETTDCLQGKEATDIQYLRKQRYRPFSQFQKYSGGLTIERLFMSIFIARNSTIEPLKFIGVFT